MSETELGTVDVTHNVLFHRNLECALRFALYPLETSDTYDGFNLVLNRQSVLFLHLFTCVR